MVASNLRTDRLAIGQSEKPGKVQGIETKGGSSADI
jgi:hypothetical protein